MLMPRGSLLFIAGQVGWDASEKLVSHEFVPQFRQALLNVRQCIEAAGGTPGQIGRVTLYVTDKTQYTANLAEIGQAWREIMGKHYPAMALLEVKVLLEPGALVEITADAVIPDAR
jgi:enamine deaminase RidA (YjgF/YER057c/UK114 family)